MMRYILFLNIVAVTGIAVMSKFADYFKLLKTNFINNCEIFIIIFILLCRENTGTFNLVKI